MKTFIKSLAITALVALVANVKAVNVSWTINTLASGCTTNFLSNGCRISAISIVNPNSVGLDFALIDSTSLGTNLVLGNTLLQASNGGYSILSSYTTNMQKSITNWAQKADGTAWTTNIYSSNVVFTFSNWVNGTTNTYPLIFKGTVASTSTFILTNSFQTAFGLTMTNSALATNISVNITYSPDF